MWKPGDLIRNKETSNPYFVVQVYPEICTLVFDIKGANVIVPLGILLERDYSRFAKDIEFKEIKGDLLSEALQLQYKKMPKIK